MNGCIIKDTPIAVDFWQIRQRSHLKIFFLSHMHGDHTKGLSGSWRKPIYCSPVTARLLPAKLHVPASLLRPLEVGESHIIPLDETGQETMTVSLIDANHCPGAVMFLFEGYFGRILYTGDFRYQPSMVTDSILFNCGQVDKLYLDNTYNNPKCVWPSRSECSANIVDIISRYPSYEIVIGVHKLGKEELLVDIALALQMRIVVNPDRMKTMKILQVPDVFTTDSSQSRIRAVPQHLVTRKNVSKWQEGAPTIAILPTALYTSLDMEPYADHPDIHVVPYSDHSSYSELIEFVSCIKPKAITPVVGASRFDMGNGDMSTFDRYLTKSTAIDREGITIPESVLKYMRSSHVTHPVKNLESKHKFTSVRKNSFKDLQKGVVFSDNIDEDLNEELERRRETEQQRQLANSLSQDDNNCIETAPQRLNLSHNSDVRCSGHEKTQSFSTADSDKPRVVGCKEESYVLKPCQSSACNVSANEKALKRSKLDVYSMLLASASKEKCPKESCDQDVIIIGNEERTGNRQDTVSNKYSHSFQETSSNGPSLQHGQSIANNKTVPSVQLPDTLQGSTENDKIPDLICSPIDKNTNNSKLTCSTDNESKMNLCEHTVRTTGSVSNSGFLKLPCSIRPVNKKRKRIDPANIFKNFIEKC